MVDGLHRPKRDPTAELDRQPDDRSVHYDNMSQPISPSLVASAAALAAMTSLAACGSADAPENAMQGDERAQLNAAIPASESDVPGPARSNGAQGNEQAAASDSADGARPLPPPGASRALGLDPSDTAVTLVGGAGVDPEAFAPRPLPPPGAFRFVGLWAAEAGMCGGQAWRFTRETMETPAGSVCKFVNATPMDGGYDISARCVAEGPPVDDMLKIRFAESAQAMLFEAGSIADAGLVYCGALDR